jgi:microcystin-dependent protein
MTQTRAELLADSFGTFATGAIPIGGIIMWSGSIASIPTGWRLCNGNDSTPDLRNKFIVGAGTDTQNVWGFNVTTGAETFTNSQTSVSVGSTGGSVAHQLTVDELAEHTHTYSKSRDGTNFGGDGQDVHQNFTSTDSGSAGSDHYHENRPPYYALAFIMRVS